MAKQPKVTRSKLSDADKRRLAELYARNRDAGKKRYAKADQLLDELLAGGLKAGDKVELAGGRVAELVDNFDGKNKHFKSTGVSRFDLKLSYDD